jgi:hypothetical protein
MKGIDEDTKQWKEHCSWIGIINIIQMPKAIAHSMQPPSKSK